MSAKNILKTLFEDFRRWRAQKAAIRHLNSLEDCHLRDVGIERGRIERTVMGSDRRDQMVQTLRHEWRLFNLMTIVHPLWLVHPPREKGRF